MKIDLINNNLKITKARMTILDILDNENSPLTAEEIYEKAKEKINVNLSTIYRNLSILTDHGLILKNINLDNTSYYQLNKKDHSHQLVCSICKETIAIDFCPIEDMVKEIEEKTNYKITGHSFEFMGICPSCQEKLNEEKQIKDTN